jgi:F-type H+-transporting ATPase subunit b
MNRWRPTVALVSLGVTPALAIAEEAAHEHAGGPEWHLLLYSTVNLAIFVWILARYVMPSVRNWVRERRVQVVSALQEAAAAKAEAEKLQAECAARLAQIDGTIAEMRTQALRDAERERERILAAAHKTAEAIRKDAERAAAYELRRTREQLRAELVRQAVRIAEEATRSRWSADDQRRFVAEFLREVQP